MPAMTMPRARKRYWMFPLGCCVIFLLALWTAHPVVEMGYVDDFTYIWSARVLADTGHIRYNGFATPMLGWLLYLGAAVIRMFGFSFVAVHAAMVPVAAAIVIVMNRVLVRMGLQEEFAAFATLTVALCPLFLPLGFSFMTDLPGLLTLLVCLYGCMRAMTAQTTVRSLGWIAVASLGGALLGTVRQVAWLGTLVLVPLAVVLMRRRGKQWLLAGAGLWLAGTSIVAATMSWYKRQPYTLIEPFFCVTSTVPRFLMLVLHGAISMCFYALPVALFYLVPAKTVSGTPLRRIQALSGAIAVPLTAAAAVSMRVLNRPWLAPYASDMLAGLNGPMIVGIRPTLFPLALRCLLNWLTVTAWLSAGVTLWRTRGETADRNGGPSARNLLLLLTPFVLAYYLLVITRNMIFDRYYLPLLMLGVFALLRRYGRIVDWKIPAVPLAALGMIAVLSTALTHDLAASQRARAAAAAQALSHGIARNELYGGYEYDGWTQLQFGGYINDPRIHNPAGAYRPLPPLSVAPECSPWFAPQTPSIHGRYELSYSPLPCLPVAEELPPVAYETWLPPHRQAIYTLRMAQTIHIP